MPSMRMRASSSVRRLAIDRLVLGHDPGERAEPGGDARARGVEPVRQRLDEHRRVEFPGLAVHVEIGAREMRAEQRRAEMRRAGEQLVDIGVFGLADRQMVEPRHLEEPLGIVAAGMGGVEHDRGESAGEALRSRKRACPNSPIAQQISCRKTGHQLATSILLPHSLAIVQKLAGAVRLDPVCQLAKLD